MVIQICKKSLKNGCHWYKPLMMAISSIGQLFYPTIWSLKSATTDKRAMFLKEQLLLSLWEPMSWKRFFFLTIFHLLDGNGHTNFLVIYLYISISFGKPDTMLASTKFVMSLCSLSTKRSLPKNPLDLL